MTRLFCSCQNNEAPDVSVIVVNYNTAHLLGRMLAALHSGRGALELQVIIVDNASRDKSVEILKTQYSDVDLVENKTNVGFGRANNQALAHVRGRYVLLLNTDAFVSADTLSKTVEFMTEHPRCGVLGVRLVSEKGDLQPSCRYFPTPWNLFLNRTGLDRFFPATRLVDDMSWDHATIRTCDWVPGCYYLMRRELIDQVGLFDPRYFLYSEEVDHCRRVREAGWDVVYYPYTKVVHIGGESTVVDGGRVDTYRQISSLQIESELLYFRKHYGLRGLFASVILTAVADVVITIKRLLHPNGLGRAKAAFDHLSKVLKLLIATNWASRPTH